jgi:hypothetical protein
MSWRPLAFGLKRLHVIKPKKGMATILKNFKKPQILIVHFILIYNGTARFKKHKQLFEYKHLLLIRDICGQSSNPYLNVVHFFNTRVD